jgi:hypothetical protein
MKVDTTTNCLYAALHQAVKKEDEIDLRNTRPLQDSPLLNLPQKTLLNIFENLKPHVARKIRGTCFLFNQLLGETLASSIKQDLLFHVDFSFLEISHSKLKIQQKELETNKTHHYYNSFNHTTFETNKSSAHEFIARIESKQPYLQYLKQSTNSEKNKKYIESLEKVPTEVRETIKAIDKALMPQTVNRIAMNVFPKLGQLFQQFK